jgi:cytidyltransferase-like protein
MPKKTVTVAISGAFDPIHMGHIRYITEAAKLGDRLVVILNSDEFLLRKKGFVFMPFAERKEILEAIKGVDEVIPSIDEDQTVSKTLEQLNPDIFAKGGNIAEQEHIPEINTCGRIGCSVVMNVGGSTILHSDLSAKVKKHGLEDTKGMRINCPYCDDHPILKEKCLYCKGTGKILVGK